ncbi:putative membrane protein [uncultured Paludibacter sp.]|uniref:Putative membrane protein n=1 Tax=uncultured Paludibacter sp. TaxID=497635 RepID=A0A653A5X1_9BACT|nr:putative membrane protein [uncultured Paludibacter sp.]
MFFWRLIITLYRERIFNVSFFMQNHTEIKIGRKDVIWNYFATFLQIGLGVLLYPVILRKLPSETVGIWSIFVSISSLVSLLDFGFDPSFTRNITYIFSGVNRLEKIGISADYQHGNINYDLLGSTIRAMRWFYFRIAILAFLLLISVGSIYIYHILEKKYTGDVSQIGIAWLIFCLVNVYNIYTLYYDSLVMGCGKVKESRQIIVVSQFFYLIISIVLLFLGFGLISIVSAQAVSVILRRFLSYRLFFTPQLKEKLSKANTENYKEIIKIISPNSIKLGLTSIGAFLVSQSSVIIGSLYLTLSQIASYGITMQIVGIVISLSSVYFSSYVPKISNLRVQNNLFQIKKIYIKCLWILIFTFLFCGIFIILFGDWALILLKSKTLLLNRSMIAVIMLIALLEKNHAVAGGFLLTKNEVPFFKASLISGTATVIILFLLIEVFQLGIWGMILAPGIAQIMYQNWKWPLVLMKELKTPDTINSINL